MKHKRRKDYEGWTVKSGIKFRMSCCDCGLSHDFVLIAGRKGSAIGIAAARNNRATAQLRKNLEAT